jgi:hypothetical protein
MLILFINIILFCRYILDNGYDDRRNIQFPNNLNFYVIHGIFHQHIKMKMSTKVK